MRPAFRVRASQQIRVQLPGAHTHAGVGQHGKSRTGNNVSDNPERRPDGTRMQILRAAAQQLAREPYGLVSLDRVLEIANVTKGALYFHFRSKHDLAIAIVENHAEARAASFDEAFAQSRPGLESMIELSYRIGSDDIGDDMARAGLNLLEALGRFDGLQSKVIDGWVTAFTDLARRAADDGDIAKGVDPAHVARLVVSLCLGLRQTSNLDDPVAFTCDLEALWLLILPGFASPDRLPYLKGFVERRTARAIKNAASRSTDVL